MDPLTRRSFVGASLGAGLGWSTRWSFTPDRPVSAGNPVLMYGDGVSLSPAEYAGLLQRLTTEAASADSYLLGGEIERFEARWARLLGKEAAVFMPSGTLANQLALRALAGSRRRVIVPEPSHVYNDTGDACQTLSGLTLLPLGAGRATYTVAEVEDVLTRTATGRVATEVGALLIESPIRRLRGQLFDFAETKRIAELARSKGIGSHLDGARIFIASAYTGISPAEYAAPFDTVYVSLWKYFNCGIGAILAGPRRVLDGMHHVRRMFGGNLAHGWPAAVVASHYTDGFIERLATAVKVSEAFFAGVAEVPGLSVERVAGGTNVAALALAGRDWSAVGPKLRDAGIRVAEGSGGRIYLGVNETWNRATGAELVDRFRRAIG